MNYSRRTTNQKITQALKDTRTYQWELAEMLDISETTLCKKLRKELPEDEQDIIVAMIKNEAGGRNA